MAVGKVSERDGFEVGWHAYFTGGVETNNIKVAALSGLLKASNGTVSAAVAGTDYATQASVDAKQNKITSSGILKGNGSGGVSAATAGTDYVSGAQAAAKESCILLRVTADQSVPANTDTVINWSLYDSKGNQLEFYPGNKRIVVKSSYITSVTVCATVCNDWDDNSNHHVYIKKNGEIILAALNDGPAVTACISIPVTTGDYIEITVYYTTAGAIKSANRTVASVQAH
mgnify:CR=1 FL=1